jgi:hypothetical protein
MAVEASLPNIAARCTWPATQLPITGNGVVSHQAAAALRLLMKTAAVPGVPPWFRS